MDPLSIGHMIKTIGALAFVCALAVIVLRKLAPRLQKMQSVEESHSSSLRIISQVYLTKEHRVALIRVHEKYDYVVAYGPQGIQLSERVLSELMPCASEEQKCGHEDNLVKEVKS